MSLNEMMNSKASAEDITAWLNEQSNDTRVREIRSLNKKSQRSLYELAAENAPLTLDYFASAPVGQECIHEGKNSLPAFTLFQKRFVRLEDGSVVGYNHGSTLPIIGPGYFVLKETAGNPDWTPNGSVVVDYYEVPAVTAAVPSHWPTIKPNHKGLQVLVYNKMHDFMRRVSDDVSIGVAFKKGQSIDSYFLLCRQPVG